MAATRCPRERLQAVALGGRWRKQHRSAKGSHLPCLPASAGGTAIRPRPLCHTQHTHLVLQKKKRFFLFDVFYLKKTCFFFKKTKTAVFFKKSVFFLKFFFIHINTNKS